MPKYRRVVSVYFFDRKGNSPKLRHDFHYNFVLANKKHFQFKKVEFADLKHVYKWCNEVVHNVAVPSVWQIRHAHDVCRGLFEPQYVGIGKRWSFLNAVEIFDLSEMQQSFIHRFHADREAVKDATVWAVFLPEPEAEVQTP